jgi:predicted membrane-bound spermidine synthase
VKFSDKNDKIYQQLVARITTIEHVLRAQRELTQWLSLGLLAVASSQLKEEVITVFIRTQCYAQTHLYHNHSEYGTFVRAKHGCMT